MRDQLKAEEQKAADLAMVLATLDPEGMLLMCSALLIILLTMS